MTLVALTAGLTLGEAVEALLGRRDLDPDTVRSYAQVLRRLRAELGDDFPLGQLTAEQAAAIFAEAWDGAAARTWNRHRSALRSFTAWAAGPGRGWVSGNLAAFIDRRPEIRDRTRAIDRHRIDALLTRRDVPLRERRCGRCCTRARPAPTTSSRSTSRISTWTTSAAASPPRAGSCAGCSGSPAPRGCCPG